MWRNAVELGVLGERCPKCLIAAGLSLRELRAISSGGAFAQRADRIFDALVARSFLALCALESVLNGAA